MTSVQVGVQHNDGGGGAVSGDVTIGTFPNGSTLTEVEVIGVKVVESVTLVFTASTFFTNNSFQGFQLVNSGGTVQSIGAGPGTGTWLSWGFVDFYAQDINEYIIPSSATMGYYPMDPVHLHWQGYVRNTSGADIAVHYTWGVNTAVSVQPVAKLQCSARLVYATWP